MRPKILVVDDENDLLDLICYNLEQKGFEPIIARDGWQAVDRAREHKPDVILLDVMLPELDGFAVCEILKTLPATASIPILFLTACFSSDARAIGMNLGATDYLEKPFRIEVLVDRLARLLNSPQPDLPLSA